MGRGTSLKLIVIIAGILVFAQIMLYNFFQRNNSKGLETETELVAAEVRSLQAEQADLQRQLGSLEKELRETAATVPPAILTGFEDHETRLTQFIDYLQSPVFQEMGGEFSIKEALAFKKEPVSLYASDLTFKFKFNYLHEAEDFFEYVLGQAAFPLQVSGLDISRKKEDKTEGTIEAAFLVPTKLPLFSGPEGESK